MFANTFPMAPLFSLLANLLEIKVKTNSMHYYSRRGYADGANGIGAW
jgi:Calcium-activated chloride channel